MRLKTQTVVLLALVALFAFFLGRGTVNAAAGKQAGVVNQQQSQDQTRTSLQQQAQLAEQPQADTSVSRSGGEGSEGGAENENCEQPGAEPGEVEDQDEPGDVDKPCPERP
jgi:hypothetical protein